MSDKPKTPLARLTEAITRRVDLHDPALLPQRDKDFDEAAEAYLREKGVLPRLECSVRLVVSVDAYVSLVAEGEGATIEEASEKARALADKIRTAYKTAEGRQ